MSHLFFEWLAFAMLKRMRTLEYLAHLHAYVVEECIDDVYLKDFSNIFSESQTSQYLGMYRLSTSLKQCVTLKFHC